MISSCGKHRCQRIPRGRLEALSPSPRPAPPVLLRFSQLARQPSHPRLDAEPVRCDRHVIDSLCVREAPRRCRPTSRRVRPHPGNADRRAPLQSDSRAEANMLSAAGQGFGAPLVPDERLPVRQQGRRPALMRRRRGGSAHSRRPGYVGGTSVQFGSRGRTRRLVHRSPDQGMFELDPPALPALDRSRRILARCRSSSASVVSATAATRELVQVHRPFAEDRGRVRNPLGGRGRAPEPVADEKCEGARRRKPSRRALQLCDRILRQQGLQIQRDSLECLEQSHSKPP